jgi:hypothetical protein
VDRGWTASGASNDVFTKLNEQRGNLSPSELYQQAAARFLRLELYLKKSGATDKSSASYFEAPQRMLTDAIAGGFCRLSADEIKRDRAFASVAGKDWFKALMQQAALPPGSRKPAPADDSRAP